MATYGYGGFGYLGGTAAAAGLAAAPNYCKNVSAVPNRADSELDWIEKPAPSQSVTECVRPQITHRFFSIDGAARSALSLSLSQARNMCFLLCFAFPCLRFAFRWLGIGLAGRLSGPSWLR